MISNKIIIVMKLFALFFFGIIVNCYGYIHIVERVIGKLEDNSPVQIKSCKNCRFYIENDKPEYSRCSKFLKNKKTHYIKISKPISQTDTALKYFLTTTSRNNESLCGIGAKYYERKYNDCY
jgi:hypothetical protein